MLSFCRYSPVDGALPSNRALDQPCRPPGRTAGRGAPVASAGCRAGRENVFNASAHQLPGEGEQQVCSDEGSWEVGDEYRRTVADA